MRLTDHEEKSAKRPDEFKAFDSTHCRRILVFTLSACVS